MKATRLLLPLCGSPILAFLVAILPLAEILFAQASASPPSGSGMPVVTIQATDPIATWSGNTALFTVFRAGNVAPALHVYCDISGTASNGQDYQAIGNWVDIPSGVLSGDLVINPKCEAQGITKTVVVTLTNSSLMSPLGAQMPVNYVIGSPSRAVVYIEQGQRTNSPPSVSIVSPTNGSDFYTPVNVPIMACARDVDGTVIAVKFFANGLCLGVVTNGSHILPATTGTMPPMPPMPPYQPFVLVWSNATPSTNILLSAEAMDNGGASSTSESVRITVHAGPPPTPTNHPPVVHISSPPNGTVFRSPVNVPIIAYAHDPDGHVATVGFFDGTNFLGFGRSIGPVTPPFPPGPIQPPLLILTTNLYVLTWSNAPQGSHVLTAVATDNSGVPVVSDPVNITVLPPLPQTNTIPVVSITAIDPIAFQGTNVWPWLGLAATSPTWTNWIATNAVFRYFTKCGPKDALFAVRRCGDTRGDLTVGYGIGGTASNGVDYVTLPGVAVIPSGQPAALIPLVPLDNGVTGVARTVVLTLLLPSNTPPAYVLGFPRKAAAIIRDCPISPPSIGMLPGQCFHLTGAGPDGAWFHVEYSDDLCRWTPACTNQVVNGTTEYLDPDASSTPVRFYRTVPESDPPQD